MERATLRLTVEQERQEKNPIYCKKKSGQDNSPRGGVGEEEGKEWMEPLDEIFGGKEWLNLTGRPSRKNKFEGSGSGEDVRGTGSRLKNPKTNSLQRKGLRSRNLGLKEPLVYTAQITPSRERTQRREQSQWCLTTIMALPIRVITRVCSFDRHWEFGRGGKEVHWEEIII